MWISIKQLKKSFGYAFVGIRKVIEQEQNMRIHVIIASFVVLFGIIIQLSLIKWLFLFISIGFVLVLEMINTVIERIVDIQKPSVHKYVSDIKDMMAGVVLIGAILSVIVGILVFGSEILSWYGVY